MSGDAGTGWAGCCHAAIQGMKPGIGRIAGGKNMGIGAIRAACGGMAPGNCGSGRIATCGAAGMGTGWGMPAIGLHA